MRHPIIPAVLTCALSLAPNTHAADLGFDWVTIGDAGNRAATVDEASILNEGRGSVGYEYRLTRTEVTVSQHRTFLQAIEPFVDDWTAGVTTPQEWFGQRMNGSMQITPGWENAATTMSFYTAAMFCNWLHNGQVNEAWAFQSGAYDVSTFRQTDANGVAIDQLTHSPGARFWIPNRDEWIKGMYWDPTKDGEGGYWLHPNQTNDPLTPGLPGEPGAQTSAGAVPWNSPKETMPIDVGSYPDAASFWGLLDGSGGSSEMLEEDVGTDRPFGSFIQIAGSDRGYDDAYYFDDDLVGTGISWRRPSNSFVGLRLASSVPPPASACTLAGLLLFTKRRRP